MNANNASSLVLVVESIVQEITKIFTFKSMDSTKRPTERCADAASTPCDRSTLGTAWPLKSGGQWPRCSSNVHATLVSAKFSLQGGQTYIARYHSFVCVGPTYLCTYIRYTGIFVTYWCNVHIFVISRSILSTKYDEVQRLMTNDPWRPMRWLVRPKWLKCPMGGMPNIS